MWRKAGLALCACVWLGGTRAVAAAPEASREQAQRLYQQKKYAAACPLFERLATEAKTDGGLWADLGLCEFRRRRREAGQRASLLAVRHGDAEVRKAAYFNLHRAGVRVPTPTNAEGGIVCEVLRPPPSDACTLEAPLWACTVDWKLYGSGGGTAGSNTVFGYGEEAMKKLVAAAEAEPYIVEEQGVPLTYVDESLCGPCLRLAWSCLQSRVVSEAADACFERATGEQRDDRFCNRETPRDAQRCDAYEKCQEQACARAEAAQTRRAEWPEARDEYDAAMESCGECGINEFQSCDVVAVEPCAGRVGYVCEMQRDGVKQPRVAEEWQIRR